jgi:hypothetical protein
MFFSSSTGCVLTTRLQKDDGLPVTGMKSHRLYAARRAVEAEHHMVYAEKIAALPRYLHDICRKNPGSFLSIAHLRKAYLELIPKEDWVHYAQVARGAHTYAAGSCADAQPGLYCRKGSITRTYDGGTDHHLSQLCPNLYV